MSNQDFEGHGGHAMEGCRERYRAHTMSCRVVDLNEREGEKCELLIERRPMVPL